eukprot:CCRYP_005574-RA/>CCRYP_005574-RA protein AED:0.07 eAED:-0.00 QI:0/-1/0/1/-1/1/1/0/233
MPAAKDLPNNLNSMTCAQLKDLLKLRDLPVSGKKAELIKRLEDYTGRTKPSKKWQNSQAKKDLKKALLDPNHVFHRMTADAIHNSDEKYKQYPLFPEYLAQMKERVAEEKRQAKDDDRRAEEHNFHFPRSEINKRGYPYWDLSEAKQWLEVDVANGLHKKMTPKELRAKRPHVYAPFPPKVFSASACRGIKAEGSWVLGRQKEQNSNEEVFAKCACEGKCSLGFVRTSMFVWR